MTFLWPELLWLLLALPGLVAVYRYVLRRKRKIAREYSRLAATEGGAPAPIKRQTPPILFLLALAIAVTALARPTAVITVPSQYQTIILAIDNSGSMSAKDVHPDRLASATAAARAFVANQALHTRIGVVAFAATASLVQPPTERREDILAAIDRLKRQPGTAVGAAILASLKAIFPGEQFELETPKTSAARERKRGPEDRPETAKAPTVEAGKQASPGSYTSAAIILFTDGQTTVAPDPLKAAQLAADRGVRIYTVGIGTPKGETISIEGWSMRVRVDEQALKDIASTTGGEYFYGGTPNDLKAVYGRLGTRLVWERRETEITALFGAAAGILALLGGLLSLFWFDRIL